MRKILALARKILLCWLGLSGLVGVVMILAPGRPEANYHPSQRPNYGDPDAAPNF